MARRLTFTMIVMTLVLGARFAAQQARDMRGETALQAAIKIETIDGDLRAAIEAYRKVAATYASDRAVVAKALVHVGQCYEKLGAAQTAEARKAYEQIVSQYADQGDVAAQARTRLAALARPTVVTAGAPGSLRRVYEGNTLTPPLQFVSKSITPDGRFLFLTASQGTEFVMRDLASGAERAVRHASLDALQAAWPHPPADHIYSAVWDPNITPDHNRIVYTITFAASKAKTAVAHQAQVRIVNIDGTGDRVVARLDGVELTTFRFTEDRKSLLVHVCRIQDYRCSMGSIRLSDGAVTYTSPSYVGSADDVISDLSPDGRVLALLDMTDNGNGVSLIDTRTGLRSRIIEPSKSAPTGPPRWAPDGSGIVVVRREHDAANAWLYRVAGTSLQGPPELLRSDLDGANLLRITRDGTFYYMRTRRVSNRFVVDLDSLTGKVTGAPTHLVALQNGCAQGWSPDGTAVAFGARLSRVGANDAAPCELVVLRRLSDSRERVMSPGLTNIRVPRWSPDGKSLLVFGQRDSTYGAFRIDLESGAATFLEEAPPHQRQGESILVANWTADGNGILLPRLEVDAQGRPAVSRLVQRDLRTGKEIERYSIRSPGTFYFTSTSVARDGTVALLVNEAGGDRAVVIVPPGDGPPRTIARVTARSAFSWASLTADAKYAYVSQRTPEAQEPNARKLIRIPVDGGEPVDAGLAMVGLDGPTPSPDGKRLLFVTNLNPQEIWAIERLVPTRSTMTKK